MVGEGSCRLPLWMVTAGINGEGHTTLMGAVWVRNWTLFLLQLDYSLKDEPCDCLIMEEYVTL